MSRTLQRLERILVMVPWLLDHPGAGVEEVSERFGVSREELASDLDVLGYCGIPGYGGGDLIEASIVGDRVVVRLAEFFSRPLRLSLSQAVTLLLAGRALAGVEGLPESSALARAVVRLEEALGAEAARVTVDLRAPGDELLGVARDAVSRRRLVRLRYRAATGRVSEREVEPQAVVGEGGAWYLQGWCRSVSAPRDFRLDRIERLEVLDEAVEPPRAAPHRPVYQPGPGDTVVVLDVDASAAWIQDEVVVDAAETTASGLRLRLRTRSLDWVARLVLQLGGRARVVEPDDLGDAVARLARVTLEAYT